MNVFFPLLAQTSLETLPKSGGAMFNPQTRDMVVIGSAILLVTVIAFFIFVIQQRRRFKIPNSKPPATGGGKAPNFFRARGSNPADEPTTRNPTLAERGGLPPIREKSSNTPK